MKENEKLKIDKQQQARKQTPSGLQGGNLGKFAMQGMITTPTARGMVHGALMKENPVMQSQVFNGGKFQQMEQLLNSKPDPSQLPFTVRDN